MSDNSRRRSRCLGPVPIFVNTEVRLHERYAKMLGLLHRFGHPRHAPQSVADLQQQDTSHRHRHVVASVATAGDRRIAATNAAPPTLHSTRMNVLTP